MPITSLFSFISNSPLKKYFSNLSWLVIEKVVLVPFSLFMSIYVARYLGPEKYGLLSYCVGFVGLFAVFSSLGIDSIVNRELIKFPDEKNKYLGTAIIIKLVGFGFFIFAVILFNFIFSHDLETSLLVFIISISFAFQAFTIIDVYFQARVESKFPVIARICSTLISVLFKLVLILLICDIRWFALAILFDAITLSVSYIIAYKIRNNSILQLSSSKQLAMKIIIESLPITISGIAINIQAYIDQVFLGQMLDKATVGQYSVAMNLISYVAFLPVIINSTLFPAITKAKITNENLYKDRLLNLYRLMFLVFLVCAIPIFIFSKPLVVLLYGQEYTYAGVLLALFSIRLFFTNFGVAKSTYIINENMLKFAMYAVICGTIVNVVLNYLLIPVYQAEGSIIATIISFFVTTFFLDFFFKKMRGNLYLMVKGIFSFYKLNLKQIR